MKKYKRWIFILTALTVFFLVHVDSLKATSLIHGKKFSKLLNSTSTSTSTSTEASSNDGLRELLDELADDEVIDANGTKITLTGIPQIDYVWDPNLPRELNGFNLSTYPFLDSMPADEDIGFDCEDKINGFYASIKYSCQLYHHCLYGVRSDFICANFTAFDQKTFICHFVSEVDCKNSYKYWSRNDDLYKATTVKTTSTSSTLVPLFDRGFYNRTRHSFLNSVSANGQNNTRSSGSDSSNLATSKNNNNNPPASNVNGGNNKANNNYDIDNNGGRPLRPLRRPPYRRRRPAVEYYYYDDEYEDDFYDDRGRRRNRPRNRRPIYDEFESRRPDNRRPYYDDFDDYEYERRPLRNRNRSEARNNGSDDRKRYDDRRGGDRRRPYEDERRPIDERRRQVERRPINDDRRFTEERRFSESNDDFRRGSEGRRSQFDERRKVLDPVEVEEKKPIPDETISDEKQVKPLGTSIFDRARPPPRVSRPVPLSEKNKYAYKASEKPVQDYNSYDYEDVPNSSSSTTTTTSTTTAKPYFQKIKSSQTTQKTTTALAQEAEYYDDEYYDAIAPTEKPEIESSSIKARDERFGLHNSRTQNENVASVTTTTTTAASSPDSFRLNRYKSDNSRESIQSQYIVDSTTKKMPSIMSSANNVKKYANKQTVFDNPVTLETPRASTQVNFQDLYNTRNLDKGDAELNFEQPKGVVRVVKRPFLPSRGGNPYKARGLQPVGNLAQTMETHDNQQPAAEVHKITLEDLYNEEYDVDLNDALNPMLKPLTSSRGVSGYSISSLSNSQPIESRSQSQKVIQRADYAPPSSTTTTLAPQPEYYDEEIEYTYADDEPSS